jgi:predicted nucleotidyltransferase
MKLNIPAKYQNDIEIATNLLKNEGCQSIFLFGSLVTGKARDDSDIDIGIKGLPKCDTKLKVGYDLSSKYYTGYHMFLSRKCLNCGHSLDIK